MSISILERKTSHYTVERTGNGLDLLLKVKLKSLMIQKTFHLILSKYRLSSVS